MVLKRKKNIKSDLESTGAYFVYFLNSEIKSHRESLEDALR